uniref:Uncharacterized protein n=1 Tax=Peronospora matthiolae TaxID=2874970 RepID=A0AAV1UKP2_9STRA
MEAAESNASDGARAMNDSRGFVLATSDEAQTTDGTLGFMPAATDPREPTDDTGSSTAARARISSTTSR